jgi:hypothetical protein
MWRGRVISNQGWLSPRDRLEKKSIRRSGGIAHHGVGGINKLAGHASGQVTEFVEADQGAVAAKGLDAGGKDKLA